MQSNGSMNALIERMRAKTEQERLELEALTRQQFDALSESLLQSSQNALRTTEAAILAHLGRLERILDSRCQSLARAFGSICLRGAILTLCILACAALSGWGLLTLAGNSATELQQKIAAWEKTAAQLEAKTWGLSLVENPKGRFIILPEKRTLESGWTIGKNPAWKVE